MGYAPLEQIDIDGLILVLVEEWSYDEDFEDEEDFEGDEAQLITQTSCEIVCSLA